MLKNQEAAFPETSSLLRPMLLERERIAHVPQPKPLWIISSERLWMSLIDPDLFWDERTGACY